MEQLELKYGCNPNQVPANLHMKDGQPLPVKVLNGNPGYINFLDALNAWQLVKELSDATGEVAATSFKHVSPTSAALGVPMSAQLKAASFVDDIEGLDDSPLALAYARARGADRMSSFGDFIALSDICDETTARVISREVSDGVIAPGYTPEALEILQAKRRGTYAVIEVDPSYVPDPVEEKQVFGITFTQGRNNAVIDESLLENVVTNRKDLSPEAIRDLLVALITLKYAQSNSVVFARDGQAIGVGAGQQSRIHCTRLAANKADLWHLRQHPRVLELPFKDSVGRADRDNTIDMFLSAEDSGEVLDDGKWQAFFTERPEPFTVEEKREYLDTLSDVALGSDAFFPFGDSLERAARSGVSYVAQPGGSIRDDHVIDTGNKHDMAMAFTGLRLFHH